MIRSALESWDLQENQKKLFLKKFDLTRSQSLWISKVFEEKWGRKTIINYAKTMNFTSFLKWLENVYILRSGDDNFYFHEKFRYNAFKWRVYNGLIWSRSNFRTIWNYCTLWSNRNTPKKLTQMYCSVVWSRTIFEYFNFYKNCSRNWPR